MPQTLKLLNRRRPVALKVVVRVSVDEHSALHDLVAEFYPTAEFRSAINDGLVPRHRLRFDLFPVAKPTDVCPACGDWIELKFQWVRHPGSILKHESDLVIPQQVCELRVNPVAIADFDPKFVVGRQLLQG